MADEALCCSFCRRSNDDLGHLLAGPGAAVCDDCLGHLSAMMAEQRPEWWAALIERITRLGKADH
jgi:ATP-dependent protease Clp ATPase subunit